MVFKFAAAFFFREITGAVGDDQSQIAGAGLVHPWIVDFVQDAVAEGEPYAAVQVERRPNAPFGARSPARRNSRPARGKAFGSVITHCGSPRSIILPSVRRTLLFAAFELDFADCDIAEKSTGLEKSESKAADKSVRPTQHTGGANEKSCGMGCGDCLTC